MKTTSEKLNIMRKNISLRKVRIMIIIKKKNGTNNLIKN